jgi:hypothetical protein
MKLTDNSGKRLLDRRLVAGIENQEFSILNIIPSLISEKHRKAAFVENLVGE